MRTARFEVVQRHDAQDGRRQRRRDLRLAHIGDVPRALHVEIMNLRMKSRANLRRVSREVHQSQTGVDEVHLEAEGLEPSRYIIYVLLGYAEFLAELLRGKPFVEVWRLRIVKIINELLKFFLQFRRTLQLQ